MTIINEERLQERARALYTIPIAISPETWAALPEACRDYYVEEGEQYLLNTSVYAIPPVHRFAILQRLVRLNGIRMVLVSITGGQALLEVHFFNRNFFAEILAASAPGPRLIFPLTGGRRVLAGEATGQVQVISVSDPDPEYPVLLITVSPIGDYSTYTLSIAASNPISIDPLFSEIDFKFRPGCFSLDCAPDWEPAPPPQDNPVIDYLAKDYHSFKHTLIAAMAQRVPGWQPTSEADLDQVLLELFCAAADELSDYQDRVMNEAYLATARKRVSLARLARLVDYHIHQGNQASTWLAVKVAHALDIPSPPLDPEDKPLPLTVWAGAEKMEASSAAVFISRTQQRLHPLVNQLGLYTWSDSIPSLAVGSTTADVQPLGEDGSPLPLDEQQDAAHEVEELIRSGQVRYFLIQEWLNPATGRPAGADRTKRQLLRMLAGEAGAQSRQDPITGEWFVRVAWEEREALKANYCFTVDCPEGRRHNASLFHGNLVPVYSGRLVKTVFKDPGALLGEENEAYFEPTERWGTLCRLPEGPLAYKPTPVGGEVPPRSTLEVEVVTAGEPDSWEEVISLVHSDASAERGDHFMVETDEKGYSVLRFGNGTNGRQLPDGAEVHCTYQVGYGPDGNLGADKLKHFNAALFPEIMECWNPFEATNGRALEPAAAIIRRAPETYRFRQLRAVTLTDYEERAEELPEVSRAAAHYAWTGSWRTVQITIDPVGATSLTPELGRQVANHLNAVRLLGEDLEIRPPRFVPLDIRVSLCIHPDYWIDDVRHLLEQEFSEGYTPDGRQAFFHPDRWTFGQKLHASEIIGRVQRVEGVDHVISVTMRRWHETAWETEAIAEVRPNEIIRVRNDPDHMEEGFMTFDIKGGRG